jgi:hypothetical protein
VQFLPEIAPEDGGFGLPAVAVGVQDIGRAHGPRRYFWVASKQLAEMGLIGHAGLRCSQGFSSGAKTWFGGLELSLGSMLNLKSEYDWDTRTGSSGIEVRINSRLVAFDHVLDLFGDRKSPSNMIGLSYQEHF